MAVWKNYINWKEKYFISFFNNHSNLEMRPTGLARCLRLNAAAHIFGSTLLSTRHLLFTIATVENQLHRDDIIEKNVVHSSVETEPVGCLTNAEYCCFPLNLISGSTPVHSPGCAGTPTYSLRSTDLWWQSNTCSIGGIWSKFCPHYWPLKLGRWVARLLCCAFPSSGLHW